MLVPSKYIKTQAERLNVLPAFIYVEREPDFVLAASVSGANLATELCCQQQVYLILMDVQTENRENGLILNYSQLTGSHLDIDEGRRELRRTDKDGKQVSYDPPRYEYSYNFDFTITVDTPYFDEMSFRLNPRPIILESEAPSVFSLVRSIGRNACRRRSCACRESRCIAGAAASAQLRFGKAMRRNVNPKSKPNEVSSIWKGKTTPSVDPTQCFG